MGEFKGFEGFYKTDWTGFEFNNLWGRWGVERLENAQSPNRDYAHRLWLCRLLEVENPDEWWAEPQEDTFEEVQLLMFYCWQLQDTLKSLAIIEATDE